MEDKSKYDFDGKGKKKKRFLIRSGLLNHNRIMSFVSYEETHYSFLNLQIGGLRERMWRHTKLVILTGVDTSLKVSFKFLILFELLIFFFKTCRWINTLVQRK